MRRERRSESASNDGGTGWDVIRQGLLEKQKSTAAVSELARRHMICSFFAKVGGVWEVPECGLNGMDISYYLNDKWSFENFRFPATKTL